MLSFPKFVGFGSRSFLACLIVLTSVTACSKESLAVPQDAAKAGLVSRDLEKKEAPVSYRKDVPFIAPEEEGAEAKSLPGGDQKIFLKAVRFKGNTSISSKKLQRIVRPYLNKEQTLNEIRVVAKTIQNYYRSKGYFLARVYVPPQDIHDDVLEMVVSEGQLGKLIVRNNKRYSEAYVRRHFKSLLQKKTMRYDRLLRPMMLLNETPSLEVAASLSKGEEAGTTDVTLDLKEKLPVRNYFTYDNTGSDFVSQHRMGSTLEIDSLLFQGDRSSFSIVGGSPVENLKFAAANYSVPLLGYGTRAEFGYNYSEFKAARELRELMVAGRAQVFHVGLTQALIRARATNADAGISFDYKQIKNYTLKVRTSDDELRVLNFNFNIDHVDSLRGRTYFNNVLSVAIAGIMGATERGSPSASRAGSASDYVLYQSELKRIQQLIFGSYLIARLRTQVTSQPLPSSEEMVIGGADTVRGFVQGEHLGDQGYILNFEARVPPPLIGKFEIPYLKQSVRDTFQFATFLDNGSVFRKRVLPGETKANTITGYGVGFRIFLPHEINLSFDWGFPLSGNASSTGEVSVFYFKLGARFL